MLVEDVQDPYYNDVVLLFGLTTKDEVIHVNDYDSLVYELSEDVTHHFLEHHQDVSEAKEHD